MDEPWYSTARDINQTQKPSVAGLCHARDASELNSYWEGLER